MNNKNFKSNSYIVREAESIIEKYLEKREMSNVDSYKILQEKYERLKILTISIFFISSIVILLNIIFK